MYNTLPHLVLPQIPNLHEIDVYRANGGYDAYRQVITMTQDEVINEVKKSGLR
ncbi:MAG TPA: NADH-quinone oxidoreductase subunit F, partial [Candidatus Kapabacteria bacterium]|nr:NADH-quinone oxidoreductase subunit F [Candidatus Kapabacteria bacterium]